ncbi:MAG: hypothetical protein GEV28_36075 [Actinophytocola sp.]|nr:hypothetical protein [Actinophytocola sp.]
MLLLFLFLPFLSVSCEVPGMGSIGADYNGVELATGAEPEVEVPRDLQDMADELPGGSSTSSEPPPDPGVQALAIIAGVVLLAGIALPFVPRFRDRTRERLFGSAAVALLAGVLVVVTQTVAQSNLTSQLKDDAQGLSEDEVSTPDINSVAGELIHTEVGFWLTLVGLVLIALLSMGFVFKDKIVPKPALAEPPGTAYPGTAPSPDGPPPDPNAQGAPVTAEQTGEQPGRLPGAPDQSPSDPPPQQS